MKMKNLVFLTLSGICLFSCVSKEAENTDERRTDFATYIDAPTVIEFDKDVYNFGEVTDGEKVEHTFRFTNAGETELVLIDVKGTCGCTVPENWPKSPIAPGESGEIDVVFNSAGKVGNVQKSIRVEANTNPTVTPLTITGKVNKKAS